MLRKRSFAAPLVLAAIFVLAAAGCREGTAPADDTPGPVLLLGDGRTEDSVAAILTEAGIEVHDGGPYWEYDGVGLGGFSAGTEAA